MFGYHIDVRSAHASKLMDHEIFIHRQTTAQAVRFTTTELADMERDMASAADRALALELEIFTLLRSSVLAVASQLRPRHGRLLKLTLPLHQLNLLQQSLLPASNTK